MENYRWNMYQNVVLCLFSHIFLLLTLLCLDGILCRKLSGLSSRISALAPRYCTVYAISKGKLASIRPPDMDTNVSIRDDASEESSASSYSSYTSSSLTGRRYLVKLWFPYIFWFNMPVYYFWSISWKNNHLKNIWKLGG